MYCVPPPPLQGALCTNCLLAGGSTRARLAGGWGGGRQHEGSRILQSLVVLPCLPGHCDAWLGLVGSLSAMLIVAAVLCQFSLFSSSLVPAGFIVFFSENCLV